jgi:predicted methyltransferase
MRRNAWIAAAAAVALTAACATPRIDEPAATPASYAAVLADQARPQADRERDAARKPAEILAFAEIRPGQTVLDVIPGGGYFTRLFAGAVGPEGKVYAYVPTEMVGKFNSDTQAKALDAAYPNVEYASDPLTQKAPGPITDVVFTAQNYHDFHTPLLGSPNIADVNAAVWSTLRPGGLYVIIDHASAPGTGASVANTLHRIEAAQVRREVEAAGFVYEGSTEVLRNPADPRTANVFDPSIRGRTDQFAMKFRKPAR